MKWNRVMEHDQRINGVLRKAYDAGGWTPVEDHTPLDELMDAEPEFDMHPDAPDGEWSWPSSSQPDLHLQALKREEAAQVAAWAREQQMRWLAGGGMHPFRIVQRFFAMCFIRYGDLIGPLNGTTLAEMLGQTRAAFSAVMRELFGRPCESKLGVPVKVAGQKSAASSAAYAANAKKHKPRQQLDGFERSEGVDVKEAMAEKVRELAAQIEADKQLQIDADAEALRAVQREAQKLSFRTTKQTHTRS